MLFCLHYGILSPFCIGTKSVIKKIKTIMHNSLWSTLESTFHTCRNWRMFKKKHDGLSIIGPQKHIDCVDEQVGGSGCALRLIQSPTFSLPSYKYDSTFPLSSLEAEMRWCWCFAQNHRNYDGSCIWRHAAQARGYTPPFPFLMQLDEHVLQQSLWWTNTFLGDKLSISIHHVGRFVNHGLKTV
jgi:hypothetical protein